MDEQSIYIGNRYVPKIEGEWDQLKEYEGLSIVTSNGNSYTSNKRVPEGVHITNESYWVKTGDYNAQVSEFKEDFTSQLAENEQEVSLLSTKVGNLGSTSTFKGSDTNAVIITKTGMNVGDEWFDTTNNKSLRWNGSSWVDVGASLKLGTKSVVPENTSFFEKGKNEFDKTKAKVGYYVNQASGAIVASATHNATDYIEGYPSKKIIFSQPVQRYAFYDANKKFISGGLNVFTLTYPANASLVVASSDSWNLETLQVEEGIVTTSYEAYQTVIPQRFLGYKPETEIVTPSFVGDINKEYRMIGANIRTPLVVEGAYTILNDTGHEPMGITSVTVVGDELRVGMNFTAKKVISMSIMPHVSLMQEGYSVATTGGLSVHAVYFYKNSVMVPAKDVVINGGSFWFSGTFLV